ncbi:MAG: hypothetical protein GY866_37070 [Proteobacteria bacterium]|nr:hypothetical protein [Pseudomonadota bacterium]
MKKQKSDIKETQYPLLATKIFIPPPRSDQVHRPLLIDRLNEGINRNLTLISAPAGFGKTTLLSEWISHTKFSAAWISLDKSDNDPFQFIHYLIAAIRSIDQSIGENALNLLQSHQRLPIESILISLIKDLTDQGNEFVLVFDDFHSIEADGIYKLIGILLDYLPTHIHLIISSRVDPPLPLARLRANNQLSEFRTADICFSGGEIATFFNKIMKLQLSNDDISIIETRTEGWIAGLQLAAISMQDREDLPSFINAFAGDDRHIVDYLIEEVLSIQPEPIQKFLLQTSILNRLSEQLCNYVTGEKNSQKTLDELDKTNLFIVPLDNSRHWYRYHHLFAELLQYRLQHSDPDRVNELHARASIWYEKNGQEDEAVNHAFVARDFERAAYLIREVIRREWEYETRMLKWNKKLPVEFIQNDPDLSFFNARMLYENGQYEAAEASLQIVERLIDSPIDPTINRPLQTEELPLKEKTELRGKIAVIRAVIAFFKGKIPDVIRFAEKAIDYLDQVGSSWRIMSEYMLGEAFRSQGEMVKANQKYSDAANEGKRIGNYYAFMHNSLGLADVKRFQGELSDAIKIFEELHQNAEEIGLSQSPMLGILYISWGEILGDLNNIVEALKYIRQGIDFSKQVDDAAMIGRGHLCLVRVLDIKGDMAGAEAVIRKMEKQSQKADFPKYVVDLLECLKVRIWLKTDRIEPAIQWMQDQEMRKNSKTVLLQESLQILIARILFAQNKPENALELLNQQIKTAEEDGRIIRVVEMLLIQVKILNSTGESSRAISKLKKAISLAKPGGGISIFITEGPLIAELLQMLIDENTDIPRAYVKKLLLAFRLTKLIKTDDGIVERLSERELEVLRLIVAGLSNNSITEELFVSIHTVKTHVRNIYGKLNVNSRTQAIAKAKELNLL